MRTQTKLIHHQNLPDKASGSIIFPLVTSTIFAMKSPSSNEGFQYSRINNPTRQQAEQILASLHNADFGIAFSSGSAAIAALFLLLKAGEEIIVHNQVYEGTARIIQHMHDAFSIQAVFTDVRNTENLKHVISKKTKMIIFETPTNPQLIVIDITSISKIAHEFSIPVVVDNTLASCMLQKPLEHKADIVIESLSKFINGHSDVIGGFIATNNHSLYKKLRFLQQTFGAILSPSDASMILRGVKTLNIRIEKQQMNAKKIFTFLKSHPSIEKVFFPGWMNEQIVKKQMSGKGSLISFTIKKKKNPLHFLTKLQLVLIGHSFGGVESVIQHPFTMMDLTSSQNDSSITNHFFRLSVGIENFEDIICDLKTALES